MPYHVLLSLHMQVNRAIDLPVKDLRNNTSSPFVKLYVLPSRRYNYTTNIVTKCVNPVFNESFAIGGLTLMEILQLTIQFLVVHHEPIHRNVIIGELMLPLVNHEFVDEELTLCQNLKEHKPKPVSKMKFVFGNSVLFDFDFINMSKFLGTW